MSIVDQLPGLVVIHDEKGIGKISEADESRVTVDMWVPPRGNNVTTDNQFQRDVIHSITDIDKSIKWGLVTASFLDSPDWSTAPDESEIDDIINTISSSPSNVVIHTSNPPRPFIHSENMEEQIELSLDREDTQYDFDMMSSISGTVELVDWSLSWFLLRKRESDEQYHQRLQNLWSGIDGRCFSEHIYPVLPIAVQDWIVHHVSTVAAARYLQMADTMSLAQVVDTVESAIDKRIQSRENIVNSFARSYGDRWIKSKKRGRGTFISSRSRIRDR